VRSVGSTLRRSSTHRDPRTVVGARIGRVERRFEDFDEGRRRAPGCGVPTDELRGRIRRVHEQAAALHEEAAKLHLEAASIWEARGDIDRAEEHHIAAAVDIRMAAAERAAWQQYNRP
jgi:hypothetical protein